MEANKTVAEELPPVEARFSAAMTRWVSACMAENDIRYYLNGIHVEPVKGGGVMITATDGHRLMSAFDKDGTANQPFIFSADKNVVQACTRYHNCFPAACKTHQKGTYIRVAGTRLTVLDLIADEVFVLPGSCIIEGNYPDWKKDGARTQPPLRSDLVPAGDAAMNFSYLAQFTKELCAPKNHWGVPSVSLWRRKDAADPHTAVVFIEFRSLPLMGILMPMHAKNENSPFFDAGSAA